MESGAISRPESDGNKSRYHVYHITITRFYGLLMKIYGKP
jgi:hypothetical protein